MNKSLLTNIIAGLLILAGYLISYFDGHSLVVNLVLSAGYFSLSGAITNWLAIYMLFEKVPGLYGSGVIPLNFEKFKAAIRNMMLAEFFSKEKLTAFFAENASPTSLHDKVDLDKAFDALKEEIMTSSMGGMLGMFGGESLIDGFRPRFKIRLQEFVEETIAGLQNNTRGNDMVDGITTKIENLIDDRLNELSPQDVKVIIQEMIRSHLGWLVVWGGLFGAIIGIIKGLVDVLL